MKKIFIFVAAIFAAISCAETSVEEVMPSLDDSVDGSNLTELFGEESSIAVSIKDSSATRVSVDTTGDYWDATWEYSDALIAYYALGQSFKYFSSLAMGEYGPEISTFTGTAYYSGYNRRLALYADNVSGYEFIGSALCMMADLSSQSEGVNSTYMMDAELGEVENFYEVTPVEMKHIGAALNLRTRFSNVPEGSTLTKVTISDIPVKVSADLSKTVDDEDLFLSTTTGSMVINTKNIAISSYSDESDEISVKCNIFPFSIAAGESIKVQYLFSDGDGVTYYIDDEIVNSSDSDVSFARATYNTLLNSCDLSKATSDTTETTLAALSASSYPADTNNWIVTDATAETADFAGIKAAIAAAGAEGRTISLVFPNLTTLAASAFINSAYLNAINLPLVTEISTYAFYNCDGLISAITPEVTTLGASGFAFCELLTAVSMPKLTTAGMSAFKDCYAIETFDLPELTEVAIFMFANCEAVVELSLPKVTYVGASGIKGCVCMTSIDLPEALTVDANGLASNYSLREVTLPQVAVFGASALSGCTALESASLPAATTLGSQVFYNSTKLTSLEISTAEGAILSTMGEACFDLYNSVTGSAYLGDNLDLVIGEANSSSVKNANLTVSGITESFKSITIVDVDGNVVSYNEPSDDPEEDEWQIVTADDGSTTAVWSDDILVSIFDGAYAGVKNVEVYQSTTTPGYYRIANIYTADLTSQIFNCSEADEEGYAVDPDTTTIYTYIDATDPDAVWIEYHNSGYYTGSTYGYFWFGSYVPDYFTYGSESNYGKMVDGYISFPASSIFGILDLYSTTTGWTCSSGGLSLLLPGGTEPEPAENSEEYYEWIGTWEVTSASSKISGEAITTEVIISEDSTKADAYNIYGWCLSSLRWDYAMPATFDSATNGWSVAAQNSLGDVTLSSTTYALSYDAIGYIGGSYANYYFITGNYNALNATMGDDKASGSVAGSSSTITDGTEYTISTMLISGTSGSSIYTFYTDDSLNLDNNEMMVGPFTLKKISDDTSLPSSAPTKSANTAPSAVRANGAMGSVVAAKSIKTSAAVAK